MSAPKKLVIAGLSATAVVASIGYAFAQSTDDTALANSNWNGAQNSSEDANAANAGPPAMPSAAVSAYNAEIGAAGTSGDQSVTTTTTTSSDMSTSSSSPSSSMAAPDSTSPMSAPSDTHPMSAPSDSSSSTATTTDPYAAHPNAANPTAGTSPDKTDITHPAVEPQSSSGTKVMCAELAPSCLHKCWSASASTAREARSFANRRGPVTGVNGTET